MLKAWLATCARGLSRRCLAASWFFGDIDEWLSGPGPWWMIRACDAESRERRRDGDTWTIDGETFPSSYGEGALWRGTYPEPLA